MVLVYQIRWNIHARTADVDGDTYCRGTVDKLYHPNMDLHRDACPLMAIYLMTGGTVTSVPSRQRKKEKAKSHRLQAGASDEAARDLLRQCHALAFRGLGWSPDAFRIANGVDIEHHPLPEDVLEHLRRPAWHEPSLGDISADFYRRTDPR